MTTKEFLEADDEYIAAAIMIVKRFKRGSGEAAYILKTLMNQHKNKKSND